MTALEIAAEIRNQEKTVVQVVEEQIAAIDQVNPQLNAVVETRYRKALEEAQDKDQILRKMSPEERKNLPPLFGVPFTCKEMIANEGMRSTMGSFHRRERMMSEDATAVRRIREAGAILLGTTNVPEVGFWFECDNPIYGSTKNPFDVSRTSGGSSGGEGAIIGAGASPFGLGSDIGGSIRLPANFCGVFGHKPSDRIVPLTGHFPLYQKNANEIVGAKYPFTVIGPIARSASDLETLLRLIAGPDEFDQNLKTDFQIKPLVQNADALKVFYLPSPIIHATTETENDIAQSIQHAARYLKEMGAQTAEAPSRLLLRAFDFWMARTWTIEAEDFSQYLTAGNELNYVPEFLRLIMGKRRYSFPALLTGATNKWASDRRELDENFKGLMSLKQHLTKMLGSQGVLLMPVHPRKAPKLNSTYSRPFDFCYAGIINALGFPSTAVPMGLSNEGLPLGLQVVAAEDQDHLCLSVAKMLEMGFGGWQKPKIQT